MKTGTTCNTPSEQFEALPDSDDEAQNVTTSLLVTVSKQDEAITTASPAKPLVNRRHTIH